MSSLRWMCAHCEVDTPNQTPYNNPMRQNTNRIAYIDWKHRYETQRASLCHLCDCRYLVTERMTILNGFPWTRWTRRQVQRELCRTIFSENIDNLWVSCYNGNNDRAAWALFVKHPRVCEAPSGSGRMITWVLGCLPNNARAAPVIII